MYLYFATLQEYGSLRDETNMNDLHVSMDFIIHFEDSDIQIVPENFFEFS